MKKSTPFHLHEVPQDQLVAFYGLAFATAAADGNFDKQEMFHIFQSLDLEPLDTVHRDIIRGYLLDAPKANDCLRILADGCDELRFAAVVSTAEVLLVDGVLSAEDAALLDEACRILKVRPEQKDAILHFLNESRRIRDQGLDDSAAAKVLKDAAAGLASVGVPIAAVYFSGTVIGLSAAGLTSGLAALGLGFGMVPGLGIAVALGIAIFWGGRKLLRRSSDHKKAEEQVLRERKAQLVIKNLQETIVVLSERLRELEKAERTAKDNEDAIRRLTERLNALKSLLEHKQKRVA